MAVRQLSQVAAFISAEEHEAVRDGDYDAGLVLSAVYASSPGFAAAWLCSGEGVHIEGAAYFRPWELSRLLPVDARQVSGRLLVVRGQREASDCKCSSSTDARVGKVYL